MDEATSSILPHEERLPPRRDLWTAAVFLVLGVAICVLCWRMPTFKEQQGLIYTAPGLVPALHGTVICVLSVWLALRSIYRGAISTPATDRKERPPGTSSSRLAIAASLCLIFCVGLIGRMPFWLAAAAFVTLFIVLFEWRMSELTGTRLMKIGTALLQGVVTGVAVAMIFERLFYVRLP